MPELQPQALILFQRRGLSAARVHVDSQGGGSRHRYCLVDAATKGKLTAADLLQLREELTAVLSGLSISPCPGSNSPCADSNGLAPMLSLATLAWTGPLMLTRCQLDRELFDRRAFKGARGHLHLSPETSVGSFTKTRTSRSSRPASGLFSTVGQSVPYP